MKICSKCQKIYDDSRSYCDQCGTELSEIKKENVKKPDEYCSKKMHIANILTSIALAFMYMSGGNPMLYVGIEIFLYILGFGISIASFILAMGSKHKLTMYVSIFSFTLYCLNFLARIS